MVVFNGISLTQSVQQILLLLEINHQETSTRVFSSVANMTMKNNPHEIKGYTKCYTMVGEEERLIKKITLKEPLLLL